MHALSVSCSRRGSAALVAPVRVLVAVCLVALSLVFAVQAQPAAAAPAIGLSKSAPATVLVGGQATYRLTATNPSANVGALLEYNLSFRDVLPIGVTYVAGSTSPATLGEPTVYTNGTTGQQTLVWANVADLAPDAALVLTFNTSFSGAGLPVGSTVTNSADAYADSDPRFVPKFNATGVVVAGSYTETASNTAAQTAVTAIKATKTDPEPEHELVRGVHDHTTVYTVQVQNNATAATNAVKVTDYLPAGLEFLGCGQVDNSGATREYPGAASLSATPAVGPQCLTPDTVSTVVNPVGYPAGTYTQIVWTVGNLAANGSTTIKYAAGIPQRANTSTFTGGTPTPVSRLQAANLLNNSGPSTREGASEQSLTNYVHAEGDYTGSLVNGALPHVTDDATDTVTSEDLAMQKSVSPGAFAQGGVATYTFTLETSEYADASNIVIVDHLPNGLCPLDDVANYTSGAPADCASGAAFAPTGATFSGVVQNADGTFDITFNPISAAHNTTTTVTFKARMRTIYTGGTQAGDPTSSGDSFTNDVALSGTTNPAAGVNPPNPTGPVTVNDDSSVTISSTGPTINKTIKPNTTPMDCSTGPYIDTPTPAQVTFSEGSRACFQIRVDFSPTVSTRRAVVTDFLPIGVTYEAGSATLTGNNNVTAVLDTTTGTPVWRLGDVTGSGRFVAPGGVFEVRLAGIISAPGAGPAPDLTGNLAKLRYSDGAGGTVSLRDDIDVRLAAPPPVAIVKGVRDVNDLPAGGNPANTDGLQVQAGDVVTYRLDVTNNGSAANSNAIPVQNPDVWDVLPAGVRCVDISAISDGGACTNPGDAGQPTFTGNGTLSAVRWQLGAAYTIAAGATRTVTYDMTIPAAAGVTQTYTNTAAVQSYDTQNNFGGLAEHLPAANIDTTATAANFDVPAASDTSNVHTASPTLAKTNTTAITDAAPNTNGASQGVIGEGVTYTVSLRVPAKTSVFNGVLTDPMPTGLAFVSATAGFSATNTVPATDPLPGGVTVSGVDGSLSLGSTYVNNTSSVQLFQVTIQARVTTLGGNTNGTNRTNTATFNSQTAATGGTALAAIPATSVVQVIEPNPTLTKTDDDADNIVVAGQVITYTLSAVNANGRPILHDSWVVDCVPNGLNFGAFVAGFPGSAATVAGNGTNGCAVGATRIAWNVGDVTTTAKSLSYTATVSLASAGGTTYTNTSTLGGSSLNDGKSDPQGADNPLERAYSRSANDTMTVQGAPVTKTANPTARTIGQRGSWTVTATIPASVNFYDAAIVDQLPQGFDPATLQTTSVTCAYADTTACALPGGGTALAQAAGPGTNTRVGWLLGDLGSDTQVRTVTVVYSAVLADIAGNTRGTVVSNLAHLSWDGANGADPTSAGASFSQSSANASAPVTVTEPSLGVTKGVSNPAPGPGDTFTYTVNVTNSSAANTSSAFNVTVVDHVPSQVLVQPGTISNGGVLAGADPNSGGGTITWTLPGPIAAGATQSLTYDAKFAVSILVTAAPKVNTVNVAAYTSLAGGGRSYVGPSATATVTPVFPKMLVLKSVDSPLAYRGEPRTFTITATNVGGARAFDVGIQDFGSAAWTYVAGSATISFAGGPATQVEPVKTGSIWRWLHLGNLDPGQTIILTLQASPIATAAPDTDFVDVGSASALDATGSNRSGSDVYGDGGPGEPASQAHVHIDSADLSIDKSHTGAPVAGQSFSWSIAVHNNGPDTSVGPFSVTDNLPAGITSPSASGAGWACSVGAGSFTCARTNPADTLASGASFPTITATVVIPANTPSGTDFLNSASVSAHTLDQVPGNNTDTDTATTTHSSDLSLDKALTGTVVAGQQATYTLTTQNNGPSDSAGPIVVTDTMPAGTTFVSADGTGWSCSQTAGTITCDRAAGLASGAVAPDITVVIGIPSDQQAAVVNAARVDGPDPDPVPGNNDDTVTTSPSSSADLSLEKASIGAFTPGDEGVYRFTVHNFGPSYADPTVRVVDTLPAELTFVGSTSVTGSWGCSAAGQDVTCDLTGRLADGDDAVVEITVDIDPDHTGNTHNDATVSSGTSDPNTANNTDGDDSASDVQSDLVIDKSHTGDATAGEDLTYTIATRNAGPSASSGPIVVTDVLPPGMSYVSATGGGWTCDATGQTITCTHLAGLGSGASASDIAVVAHVAADAGPATLDNVASVGGPESDPTPGNNTDHDSTDVVDDAEITLTKTVSGANPVDAGSTTSFDITVHNAGPSDADSLSVVDTLPIGLTLVSASGSGWDCTAAAPITCTRDVLAAGADATITVVARVGSGIVDGSSLTNSATVTTATPGDDPADDTDDATVDVHASADLTLDKSHTGGTVPAGTQVAFLLQVDNEGPSDAVSPITVTDTLPVGLTYAASSGLWTCLADPPTGAGQQVVCTLDTGGLIAGASAPALHITAQVDASSDPGTYTNSATVASDTDDPTPGNNTDTDDVDVNDVADVTIVKTHVGTPHIGDPLEFDLVVSNAGPSEARTVHVDDALPVGLEFVSASGTGWTCQASPASVVGCDLAGPLAAGTTAEKIVVSVVMHPDAYPSADNTATVTTSTHESDTSNNSSTDPIAVPALSDLSIVKRHTKPLKVGSDLIYRLAVTNNGPTDDPGPITVTDVLPTGLTYASAGAAGWTCGAVGQTVTCVDADGMVSGAHSTILLTVDVGASAYPSVVNTASVTSPTEDTDPSNNSSSDPADVRPRVDLSIDKALLSLTPDVARYRITVSNAGPNDTVSDVVVVDHLPGTLTYDSASGAGWQCDNVSSTITCTHAGVIEVGAASSFTVTADVHAQAGTKIVNTATVTAGDTDGPPPADSETGTVPSAGDHGNDGPGDGNGNDPGDHGNDGPGLPGTGGLPFAWVAVGLLLVLSGSGMVWVTRRRHP